jgi:hypothetical protein
MKAKFLGLLAYTAIGIVATGPSHAMSLVGTTSDALGIDGLVVDGVTYDVTFYDSPYNSVYSSTLPTFLGNSGGAADAASALASALTSLDVTQLAGIGPQYNALLVPFSDATTGILSCAPCSGENTSYVAFQSATIAGTWTTVPPLPGIQSQFNISGQNDSVTYSCCEYVVFTAASTTGATPLPATLPLFATGLGGLGLLGWRRKRKAQVV